MPPKELYGSQVAMRLVNPDGTYGKPITLDSFEPLSIDIDGEPLKTYPSDAICFSSLTDTTLTFTGELKLSYKKISRKKFKKLLMSKGINRDLAEWFCVAVSSFKGKWSYRPLYSIGIFSPVSKDLIVCLFDALFPISYNQQGD